jgi:hypothetical protein
LAGSKAKPHKSEILNRDDLVLELNGIETPCCETGAHLARLSIIESHEALRDLLRRVLENPLSSALLAECEAATSPKVRRAKK